MGRLYDLATQVSRELESRHAADPVALVRAKGALATQVGFLVSLVSRDDADDPDKIARLTRAALDLGLNP
jgi:hypothetical protein